MASRVKTIEYCSNTNIAGIAVNAGYQLSGATQIYITETGGTFSFKSVVLFVDVTESGTTVASLTGGTIGIRLGATAYNNAAIIAPVVNSGENQAWTLSRNVTSYFTSTWTGSNMTWGALVVVNPATFNYCAKLIITYQYDDTAATNRQLKTIRIPIESTRTVLTTTFQTVGGPKAIPGLPAFLPESGVTVRDVFLELWGNDGCNSATAHFQFQYRLNGGTAVDIHIAQVAQNSSLWVHALSDITGNANITGDTIFEMASIQTTTRGCTVGGMIVVTYEFNSTTSTTILNSLMLGAVDTAGWIGGTTSADQGVWERTIYIEEPDPIALRPSALCLTQNDSAGYNFTVAVSGDTVSQGTGTTYTMTAGALQCGCYSLVHRIDGGATTNYNKQPGISLKRGKNLYRVAFWSNTADAGWNLSGFLLLNYTSGVHANGPQVHTHAVYQHVCDNLNSGGLRANTSLQITPTIPETYYYLIGFVYWVNYSTIGASTDVDFTVDAEVVAGDPLQNADGWLTLYTGTSRSDGENMNGWVHAAARTNFTRWNGDPDDQRINLKNARKYRLSSGGVWSGSMGYWYTYNNITYTISGTCTGFSSDGSGIPIDIYRVNTQYDDLILTTTTDTGGTFTTWWVDNTDTLYAVGRQDDTHVGRSRNGLAI